MAVFVSAIIVAGETMTVAAIATAVAETGIALNVVGHITGNQTLEKVGGVMSMAGGVASLATSAFSAASAASASSDIASSDVATSVTDGGMSAANAAPTFNDAANVVTNADGSVIGAGSQLPAANAIDTGANAADLSGAVNAADTTPVPTASPANQLSPNSPITQEPLSPTGAGAGNGLDPTGSTTAAPLSGNTPNQGLGGGGTLTNGKYDPLGTSASTELSNAPTGTAYQSPQFQGGTTTDPQAISKAASAAGQNPNNVPVSDMLGQSANLTPGSAPTVSPGGDLSSNWSAASGGTSAPGTGGSMSYSGTPNAPSGGLLDGVTNWVHNNQNLAGRMFSDALQGVGNAYAAGKNYELGTNRLALEQQIQANRSAQVGQQAPSGIINGARKKGQS